MECRNCGYQRKMTPREMEYGMLCPKCHCQNLRETIKVRPGRSDFVFRPVTIRTLLGAGIGLFVGPAMLLVGWRSMVGVRIFAYGIVITGASLGALGTGLWMLQRDLSER
jgi:hypothetical protein